MTTPKTFTVIFTRDCRMGDTEVAQGETFEAIVDENSEAVEGYRIYSATYDRGHEWDGKDLGFLPLTSDLVERW